MKLALQKKLAAKILKCSPKRVIFDTTQLVEIKESITGGDIRSLIKGKIITSKQKKGVSRLRAKKRQQQRKKGRQRGPASKQGSKNARDSQKRQWINRIRKQRDFLKEVREKNLVTKARYRELYMKAKGGFFRSLRHLKIYMDEHKLFDKSM